jgi:hypothetical protein
MELLARRRHLDLHEAARREADATEVHGDGLGRLGRERGSNDWRLGRITDPFAQWSGVGLASTGRINPPPRWSPTLYGPVCMPAA